jgi:hypothetical protein
MKDLTLAFTIIIKGCIANKTTPEQMASQLNEHVQHEVKNLNIPAVIKSVCDYCTAYPFDERGKTPLCKTCKDNPLQTVL